VDAVKPPGRSTRKPAIKALNQALLQHWSILIGVPLSESLCGFRDQKLLNPDFFPLPRDWKLPPPTF
jgi:hypothetical protein